MLSALNSEIELLDGQAYKNVAAIPIRTPINYKFDILTLKNGFILGLAEVKELEHSTVNTLSVKNRSVTPLLLVDGEEIIGGDQNRIVNSTVLVAPQSEMKIPVNCTEHGRWGYKHDFRHSNYIANSRTRFAKMHSRFYKKNTQHEVWRSIDELEDKRGFRSPTQAMTESYDNAKIDFKQCIEKFKIADGQTGIVIIVDGKIKGFELFFNPQIYAEYHEKIIKSYLIDAEMSDTVFAINLDEARQFIMDAVDTDFRQTPKIGLETPYEFKNENGLGTVYCYQDEILHLSYFSSAEDESEEKKENFKEDVDITV